MVELVTPDEFQSTRPLRGATLDGHCRPDCVVISIHAPLAGRDRGGDGHDSGGTDFNPRAPCGARLKKKLLDTEECYISIHAPLAGRDAPVVSAAQPPWNFNPRAPCGARRIGSAQITIA